MSELPTATQRWLAAVAPFAPEVVVVPEGTKTAADAAAGVGCEVRHIVKSLVFEVDGNPVVALVPGDRRLDTGSLARAVGGRRATRASLETVRAATGFAAGGTPPFGHATDVAVIADIDLDGTATLWIAAGTPNTVAPITRSELLALSGASTHTLGAPD